MDGDLIIPACLDRRPKPPALPNITDARLPQTYEAAKTALSNCVSIDECMDWADKAAALASYAKQADDDTLEKQCIRIKARAVRRAGELLKTLDGKGNNQHGAGDRPTQEAAARDAGMSRHQQKQAVRVANVPAAEFDTAVESDTPPTVTALADKGTNHRPAPGGFKEATSAIGTLRSFAAFCEAHSPELVAGGVCEFDKPSEIRADIATIDAWLDRFVVNLKG